MKEVEKIRKIIKKGKINIYGTEYKISFKKELSEKDRFAEIVAITKKEISIKKEVYDDKGHLEYSFKHEVTHAFIWEKLHERNSFYNERLIDMFVDVLEKAGIYKEIIEENLK